MPGTIPVYAEDPVYSQTDWQTEAALGAEGVPDRSTPVALNRLKCTAPIKPLLVWREIVSSHPTLDCIYLTTVPLAEDTGHVEAGSSWRSRRR